MEVELLTSRETKESHSYFRLARTPARLPETTSSSPTLGLGSENGTSCHVGGSDWALTATLEELRASSMMEPERGRAELAV